MNITININNKSLSKQYKINLSDYNTDGFLVTNEKGEGFYIQENTLFTLIENEFNKKGI